MIKSRIGLKNPDAGKDAKKELGKRKPKKKKQDQYEYDEEDETVPPRVSLKLRKKNDFFF